jgi:hypothetical protein
LTSLKCSAAPILSMALFAGTSMESPVLGTSP